MRYEWGLAVGHQYTHQDAAAAYQKIIDSPPLTDASTGLDDELAIGPGRSPPPSQSERVAPSSSSEGWRVVHAQRDDDELDDNRDGDDDENFSGSESSDSDEEADKFEKGYDSEGDRELALFG